MTNCFFGVTADGWNQSARVGREHSWAAAHKDSVDRMCRSILKVSRVSPSRGFSVHSCHFVLMLYIPPHLERPICRSSLWLCGCEGEPAADCCLCRAHSTCVNLFFFLLLSLITGGNSMFVSVWGGSNTTTLKVHILLTPAQ